MSDIFADWTLIICLLLIGFMCGLSVAGYLIKLKQIKQKGSDGK